MVIVNSLVIMVSKLTRSAYVVIVSSNGVDSLVTMIQGAMCPVSTRLYKVKKIANHACVLDHYNINSHFSLCNY